MKYLRDLIASRRLLQTLILNEFSKQYLGSYFGLFWAFAQPITFIVVIWFVFEIGFRDMPTPGDAPFFLWLICAMIPWFFFASGLGSGANAIVSNSFLVKKVSFHVSILPLVQIGSALIIHLSLLALLVVVFLLYGYMPDLYWLQLFYYLFCTIFLLLGISWLTSSIRVFVKDVTNLIAVVTQIGFWATPIFWQADLVPEKYAWIIKLNPMYYVTQGFRDALINKVWFWEKGYEMLFFMGISMAFFMLGALVFKRLRPHFGDVL